MAHDVYRASLPDDDSGKALLNPAEQPTKLFRIALDRVYAGPEFVATKRKFVATNQIQASILQKQAVSG